MRMRSSYDHVLVDATHLMSRGLPWSLVLLNGEPGTAVVYTGGELPIVSPDTVLFVGLTEMDCDCPLLVMGEGGDFQLICIVWAQVNTKR